MVPATCVISQECLTRVLHSVRLKTWECASPYPFGWYAHAMDGGVMIYCFDQIYRHKPEMHILK
jgi:hypothetical protein